MKYYITAYCLTKGIFECEDVLYDDKFPENLVVLRDRRPHLHLIKPEWHSTLDSALLHANEMRNKKIVRLKAQLDRLNNLDFSKEISKAN